MGGLRQEARLLALALQFLTRLPVPAAWDPALMPRAVRHFPLVGAGVGAFGAAVALAAAAWWPPAVAATLSVAATVWLTAALHEDGLADTCDALLGAAGRERALAIMQDARIGTYGAAALVLVLLLRVALLATLLARGPWWAAAALVASHAAGRALAVALMATLAYARPAGEPSKAGAVARGVQPADAAWAVATGVLLLGLAAAMLPVPPKAAGSALLALALLGMALRRWLQRRLGGCTGDTLGAAEQAGEVVVLACWAAGWAA